MPKKLVVVKMDWPSVTASLKSQIQRTCRLHHVSLSFVDKRTPHPVAVHEVSGADYAVVWNGSCPLSTWAVDVRKYLNKHVRILEVGWFKQNDYWHFDSKGISGKSTLCERLPEASDEAYEKLESKRTEYETLIDPTCMKELNLPNDYILCPFQVSHDVTVYYDAPFKFNDEFAEHVIARFPDDPIVFKIHPKQTRDRVVTERDDVYVVREGDFIDYTPNAKMVYGQTSTTLLESALLGVLTQAIGNCPLYYHQQSQERIDNLLATMLDRQIDRNITTDLWPNIIGE